MNKKLNLPVAIILLNFAIVILNYNLCFAHSQDITSHTNTPRLCVAVRGNGEVVFAHWPALAQIVEHYGPIDILSGGSSASYSLFLYESISKNPNLSCLDNHPHCLKKKSLEISLLLKSLQGYFDYWITTKEVNALGLLYKYTPKLKSELEFWTKSVESNIENDEFKNYSLFQQALILTKQADILLNSSDLIKIINPDLINFLKSSVDKVRPLTVLKKLVLLNWHEVSNFSNNIKMLKYRIKETKDAVKLVLAGGFDAKNDKRIFFRPGLISFNDLAHKFGRIADFYAGYFYTSSMDGANTYKSNAEISYQRQMKQFLATCAFPAQENSWTQLAYSNYSKNELSLCGKMFRNMLAEYRTNLINDELTETKTENMALTTFARKNHIRKHRIDDLIGEFTPHQSVGLFPSTSVLNKEQSIRYEKLLSDYYRLTDENFGIDYHIPYDSISFGYWGSASQISLAQKNIAHNPLYQHDLKSQKMVALGQTTWKIALATSGAEPGLSPIKKIAHRLDGIYSAGGWADLHPTILLKSLNCQNTVYITRINGETIFGQGVVKRLLNLAQPSWDMIDPKGGAETRKKNNSGDPNDLTSTWSNLYNLANPNSSLAKSIKAADAVWCTDWDTFDIKNGYTALLDHSFNAKFYINPNHASSRNFFSNSFENFSPIKGDDRLLNSASSTLDHGWPSYAGCIPFEPL